MDGFEKILAPIISTTQAGTGLFGEIGNIMAANKRGKYQDWIMSLLKNPAAMRAFVNQFYTAPNAGLIQSIQNTVQGDMASRGLAQAPGIFAATESQALAPVYQEQLNKAQQDAFNALGLGSSNLGGNFYGSSGIDLSKAFGPLFDYLNKRNQPNPAFAGSGGSMSDLGLTPGMIWGTPTFPNSPFPAPENPPPFFGGDSNSAGY